MQKYVIFEEKESEKSSLKVKIIRKLEIIVIIQENIEAHLIVFVIQNFMCLIKFLYFFTTDQNMIIILSKK